MKKIISLLLLPILMCSISGCDLGIKLGDTYKGAGEKVRDLDYTILSEERIPKELLPLMEERQEEAFEMTYSDKEFLYICIGYGRQEYSGHSIVVNNLFLGEKGILIDTSLIGPEAGKEKINTVQYPYIVVKTELMEDVPLFTK